MEVDRNRRVFEKRSIGAEYGTSSDLQKAEAAILEKFRPEIEGARILDLGVGGGRTTPYLLALSRDYVGTDYSREMVEQSRKRFPNVRFEVVDARDMSAFPSGSFDFAIFSFNGLDCVGHEDRLKALKEVKRVLKKDGLFVFSSHNRSSHVRKPWELSHLDINPVRHPIRFGKRLVSYLIGNVNYLRGRRNIEIGKDYSILNDAAHMYSLLNYYIGIEDQKRQLSRLGFSDIQVVGMHGQFLSDSECKASREKWIYYVSRPRPAAAAKKSGKAKSPAKRPRKRKAA